MNAITKLAIAAGISLAVVGAASAKTEFVPTDENVTTQICVTAATGNVMMLRQAVKESRLNAGYVRNELTCNEMPLVEFVEQYGNNIVAINDYITKGEYSDSLQTRSLVLR